MMRKSIIAVLTSGSLAMGVAGFGTLMMAPAAQAQDQMGTPTKHEEKTERKELHKALKHLQEARKELDKVPQDARDAAWQAASTSTNNAISQIQQGMPAQQTK